MKRVLQAAAYFVGAAATFTGGFVWSDVMAGDAPNTRALGALVGVNAAPVTAAQTYQEAAEVISQNYYRPLEEQELNYAARAGLVQALGDPHTVFMEPRIAEAFTTETRGNFVGIGARLSPDPLGVKIMNVFEDGPAARSGVKAGDTIIAVDGNPVGGQEVDDIVQQIRGEAGTIVRLRLQRSGAAAPIEIPVRRAQVIVPNVEQKMLDGQVGYIQVSSFTLEADEQFSQAMDRLESAGARGYIIDLRSNPGGVLETAAQMLGHFVENQVVVTMRHGAEGSPGASSRRVFSPGGRAIDPNIPVVVLINEDSASASEIFAGVLQDYKRAKVVGEHSYGKASVQELVELRDGSQLKVTVARYYLPSDRDISRRQDEDGQYLDGGLKPDIPAELVLDSRFRLGEPANDSQLAVALAEVKARLGVSSP